MTDRLVAAGLLAWAAPDVPWWWRPPGHAAATPVVLGYVALMLAQSVPFLWWRRVPLQAGAARLASQNDPTVAVRTVGGIEDIARQGLIELNRLVGALRRDEHEQLDRRPQPRLDDLPDLVNGARSAGLLRLQIEGPPRSPCPPPSSWPPTASFRSR